MVRRLSGRSSIPHRFPHGDTFETGGMTASQINLLANMAGWVVANPAHRDIFLELFDPPATVGGTREIRDPRPAPARYSGR